MKIGKKDYIYLRLNEEDRFVVSIGWETQQFMKAIPYSFLNLLLLNHAFDEVDEYDSNTRLNFIDYENVNNYLQLDAKEKSLFSWIDFENREDLSGLTKSEVAELLYLSHMIDHIRAPFYSKLNNKIVYLSEENTSYSKIYFQKWKYFTDIFGLFVSTSMEDLRLEKNFFGFSKKSKFDKVPASILLELFPLFEEGVVFSLSEVDETRLGYSVSFWEVGDYSYEDDLYEASKKSIKKKPNAILTLTKKTKGWNLNLS